ncbi:cupin domain-containing protein [Aestuariivivens sediminicola]|uniref:cupin domain-containing protein n=1 Tax=Aestuariivivens sediminicola TaxID=2913560 RepID=UPI001F5960F1|nr:cupin domain-containing protein [Aestuariivivens sediminicola]
MTNFNFTPGYNGGSSKVSRRISGLVFLLFLAGSHAQKKDVSSQAAVAYTIENCVNEFNLNDTIKTKVGYQYWFVDKEFLDGRTLKMSVVGPYMATHPPHKHEEDEFFYVLEGTAEFYLNGETHVSGPNTSFYCPSWYEHGIRNVGDTELKYLVIKKYNK